MNTQRIGPWRLPACALRAAALAAGMVLGISGAQAADNEPIRVGVIAPFSAIDGASIVDGRKIELFKYDNHASATNGATEGVISSTSAVPGEALTPETEPFTSAYTEKFGTTPAYNAYSTDDAVYVLKQAIERAHSTNANALVKALEKTDYVGTFGRIEFYGPKAKYAHGMKYGKAYVTGTMFQWQNGKQVPIWPTQAATAKPEFALLKK
jgi:Periplasmic binding protein